MCVPWRLPSIGPIWRRQASHGEGKSGPVETGLTGPVATALSHCQTVRQGTIFETGKQVSVVLLILLCLRITKTNAVFVH